MAARENHDHDRARVELRARLGQILIANWLDAFRRGRSSLPLLLANPGLKQTQNNFGDFSGLEMPHLPSVS